METLDVYIWFRWSGLNHSSFFSGGTPRTILLAFLLFLCLFIRSIFIKWSHLTVLFEVFVYVYWVFSYSFIVCNGHYTSVYPPLCVNWCWPPRYKFVNCFCMWVRFLWVHAHIGVEGNEMADEHAKRVTDKSNIDVKYSKAEITSIIKAKTIKKW